MLVVAAVGLGLNLRAWILVGPQLHQRFHTGSGQYIALVGIPLLVAALSRLPVGVLTDRFGARVTFPFVSLAAAGSAFALGAARSPVAVVVGGAAAGVAGTSFVVGSALVSRTFAYGRRGLTLGVFSLGTAVAVVISAVSWAADPGGRRAAVVLGGLLVGFAGLAAVVLRDPAGAPGNGCPGRRCLEMIRLASTSSLTALYALALGGMVAIAVYLPVYLTTTFGFGWFHALEVTGAVVGLASVARLAGGWWADRHPTARLLMVCYAVAAGLCTVMTVAPALWWPTAPVIAGVAVCDGLASGALLALIGKAARADCVGAVMGVTGAVGALGALFPPLLLAGVDRIGHSHSAAWAALACTLLGAALYVSTHSLPIRLGLAMPLVPDDGPTAMTVAVVGEADTRLGGPAVVARLAELATRDELVVVYGSDRPIRPPISAHLLVAGLRNRLPRHSIVAVRVAPHTEALGPGAELFAEFVDAGAVPIAVTRAAKRDGVAAELFDYLKADRVLAVSFTLAHGARLRQLRTRGSRAANGG